MTPVRAASPLGADFERRSSGVDPDLLPASLRVAEVASALSRALDLGSGSSTWHSVRACILGMRIAAELKLPQDVQNDLYYALLLKDADCGGSPSQASVLAGPTLVRLMQLSERTAAGIESRGEHWDGRGMPGKMRGEQIPITSRIVLLAQALDVLFTASGPDAAINGVGEGSRRWFDPDLVKAARSLSGQAHLWTGLATTDASRLALQAEPAKETIAQRHVSLDAICEAFAAVVDAKSSFTSHHSNAVANAAAAMADKLGLTRSRVLLVRRAALLHDLGKMAVANTILQKPGKLSEAEWRVMRTHPEYTWRILHSLRGFEEMSEIAASHHETLDGTGYFRGLSAPQLPIEARILVVADIFDALSSKRPYRDALPPDKVFQTIRKKSPHMVDPACLDALKQVIDSACGQLAESAPLPSPQ